MNKPEKPLGSNAYVRKELALACRALADYGIGDIDRIYNHVCALAKSKDGRGKVMLLVPFAMPWKLVTPEAMLEVDMALGEDGFLKLDETSVTEVEIVKAMVKARPDARAMFHCHPVYASCLGCIKDEDGVIEAVNVSCMSVVRDVEYYSNTGKKHYDSELDRWFNALGQKNVLMLENHGVTTIGHSVAQAFDKMVAVEQACELQVKSLSCGKPIRLLSKERVDRFIKLIKESYSDHAQVHLDSCRHLMPGIQWPQK